MYASQPGSKFCPACGNPLRPNVKFCARCGKAIAKPVVQSPPVFPSPFIPPAAPTRLPPLPIPPNPVTPSALQRNAVASNVPTGRSSIAWMRAVLVVCLAVGVLALLIVFSTEITQGISTAFVGITGFVNGLLAGIWAFVKEAFTLALVILFFPLIFSFSMIILGAITNMLVSGAADWSVTLGLWLLTQPWWWFPVGQIFGLIMIVAGSMN